MPLRKLFGWLSTIHPNKVKPELRETILHYQNECDDVLWEHWNNKATQPAIDPPTLTRAQQGILFNRVKAISGGDGKMRSEIWSRFQNHFKLSSYTHLPADQFDNAMLYLDAKQDEYRGGVEMFYLSSKELEQRIQAEVAKALPPPVKEGELASAANTIDVNLKFPDGLRQIAFKFNTEGFHDGRWCMTLSDGNVIIRMMDQNEMAMTFDKWINYAQQERGYVVIKKADVVHKLLA